MTNLMIKLRRSPRTLLERDGHLDQPLVERPVGSCVVLPEIFQDLRGEISEYSQRQRVLPGITGWAQINNGYDQTFQDVERKLGYDLEYLHRRSPVEDLKIMAKTVPVVLGRKGYH